MTAVSSSSFSASVTAAICIGDYEGVDEGMSPSRGLFNVGCMVGDMYANEYNFAIPGNSYGINCLTFGYTLGHRLAAGDFE